MIHNFTAIPAAGQLSPQLPVLAVGAKCAHAEINNIDLDLSGFDVIHLKMALRSFPEYEREIQLEIVERQSMPAARSVSARMQALFDIKNASKGNEFSTAPPGQDLKTLEKITQLDLGPPLGKGGNKQVFEMASNPEKVIAVGRSLEDMEKELKGLKTLKKAGIPTLEVEDRVVMLGTQPCLILQKVHDARNTKGKGAEFNERLNETSLEDFRKIKSGIETHNMRIGDFQIMADGVSGHAWVHDPEYVIEGFGRNESEIRLIDQCLARAESQIATRLMAAQTPSDS